MLATGYVMKEERMRENLLPPCEIFFEQSRRVARSEQALVKGTHQLFEVGEVCAPLRYDVAGVQKLTI